MKFKFILALFLFLIAIGSASAIDADSQNYEFQIVGDNVHVSYEIIFGGSVTGSFEGAIPEDAVGISLYVDDKLIEYSEIIQLSSAKKIRLNYLTHSLLDKGNFLASIPAKYNTTKLTTKLILDEGASIEKEKSDGIKTPSVFPEPDEITSDGQSIILVWEEENTGTEEFPIYVRLKQKRGYTSVIIAVLAIIAVIIIVKITPWKKKDKKKQKEESEKIEKEHKIEVKKEEQPESKKDDNLLEHLKEDEQQIVRVLKDREGSCEQGTLRVVTGFSKAHLSRLLSELEARKIVLKEKRGKKNLVFLK